MNLLRLCALTLLLGPFAAGHADDTESQDPVSAAADATAEAPPAFRWSDYPVENSLLLPQWRAVIALMRAREAAEHGIPVESVEVVLADNDVAPSGTRDCRRMALTGSRIMEERCFYESPGEAALNEYQYEMERVYMQEAMERQFLETAEYEMEYRRQLHRQGR